MESNLTIGIIPVFTDHIISILWANTSGKQMIYPLENGNTQKIMASSVPQCSHHGHAYTGGGNRSNSLRDHYLNPGIRREMENCLKPR